MTTVPSPTRETEEEKRRKSLLPLFLLLLFFLLATSCIVGFLLGRTTEPGRYGALIDTIVLSPEKDGSSSAPSGAAESPAADGEERRINLVGLVRYTDGVPFTQGSVRLQSEPRYSQLTDQGHFRFDQVETGVHELAVLDRTGNELAHRTIEVERDAEKDAYMEYQQEVCVLHIKLLTIEVDVEITLGDEPGDLLDVKLVGTKEEAQPVFRPTDPPPPETGSGRPGGSDMPTQAPPAIPEETAGETNPPAQETSPAESSAKPTAGPAETPGQIPGTTSNPAETAKPTTSPKPTATPKPTASPKPTTTPKPSRKPSNDDDDDHGGGGSGGGVVPIPTPTATPAVGGDTEVYHGDTAVTWTQQAEIDLFRLLNTSEERLIAPGSEGYYVFRLKNGRDEPIRFTLALQEGSFHVPLEYRVTTDELIPKGLTQWQTASVDTQTVSGAVQMEANGEKLYRIEWRWPFDGDDGADTALGQQKDRTYTLRLTIQVEGGA